MANKIANRVKMTVASVASSGTGDITLGSAVAGGMSFTDAGVADGNTVPYVLEAANGDWEIGVGTYTASGTILARTTVTKSSVGGTIGTSKITAASTTIVMISPLAADMQAGTAAGNLVQLDSNGAVPVGQGGTGLNSLTSGYIPFGNGTSAFGNSPNLTFDGNSLLVGASAFTSTLNAGVEAIGGIGIYPFTSGTGITNSTLYSSLNVENATAWTGNSGASSQNYYGIISTPKLSNSGSGGTASQNIFGIYVSPTIQSLGASANAAVYGIQSSPARSNTNDLGTAGALYGAQFVPQHATTLPSTAVTTNLVGVITSATNASGITTSLEGNRVAVSIGTPGSGVTSATNIYAIRNNNFTVGAASGNTATVTTGYGISLIGPTVGATGTLTTYYGYYLGAASVTGTLTNRWGVYIADTVATNYFGNSVLIGTTTTGASKLVVADSSIQINSSKTPASASDTGTQGQVCWDSSYVYVCTATNTWKRAAIASW